MLAARHRDHADVVLKLAPTGVAVPHQARALRTWRDTAGAPPERIWAFAAFWAAARVALTLHHRLNPHPSTA